MTKPTIGLLVVVTAVPTLFMAGAGFPGWGIVFAALVGTYLASSSAGVFNHLVDSDIDSVMDRTNRRPLPSGKVNKAVAGGFAAVLGIVSFLLLYYFASPLAAIIAVLANVFYVVGYTIYLKRRTVQNIVIGGAAGAVGPLIGWSAVSGDLGWPAWILFLIIFFWTPPHFWALAIKYKDDYARAKIPMLPSVKGDEVTRKNILVYTLLLIPVVYSLYHYEFAGLTFVIASMLFTLYFAFLAFRLFLSRKNKLAMPLFYYSCIYLFAIFGALTIDRLVILL